MVYLLLLVALLLLLLGPQIWVQRVLARYNREVEANFPGNGGELARHLLDRFSLTGVAVEATSEGDHYDPESKTVRLTQDKLSGRTLTAITTAAHEVGHALQDAAGEPLFRTRSRLVTFAVFAQKLGSFLLFAAPVMTIATRAPSAGLVSAVAAFLILGTNVIVQAVTLPVELDASFKKALPLLKSGYLTERQLVWCPILQQEISVSRNSPMQGVLRREWRALFKEDNAAEGCFSTRPKGSPQIPQSCVAVLDKGMPLPANCALSWEIWGLLITYCSIGHHTMPYGF